MPAGTPASFDVSFQKPDGSKLEARVERRPLGNYAIDGRTIGLGRFALCAPGARFGTKDPAEARALALEYLAALAGGDAPQPVSAATPQDQVDAYVDRKEAQGKMTPHTGRQVVTILLRCWAILIERKGVRTWGDVTRPDITRLAAELDKRGFGDPPRPLSNTTQRKYLNYAKGFFRYAKDSGIMGAAENPIMQHSSIPSPDKTTREWLRPHEMGRLLEASFKGRKSYRHMACYCWPEILATLCYTGAREKEVLGLKVSDFSPTGGAHGGGQLTITETTERRLKNTASVRVVPVWPALRDILVAYKKGPHAPPADGLLFPNPQGKMWGELRASMARDLKAAGIHRHVTEHGLRHSYISARSRMYTEVVHRGRMVLAPVTTTHISREVGHGSARMTREVYDHDSGDRIEGLTELDYATALGLFRRRLTKPSAGRTGASSRTKAKAGRKGTKPGPTKAKASSRKTQRPPRRP